MNLFSRPRRTSFIGPTDRINNANGTTTTHNGVNTGGVNSRVSTGLDTGVNHRTNAGTGTGTNRLSGLRDMFQRDHTGTGTGTGANHFAGLKEMFHRDRTGTANGTSHHHNNPESGYYNSRPLFGQWLKVTWPDLLTMVVMGMIGLGVYQAHPAPTRSFPVTFQDGEVVYPQFAYPLRKEIVPIWLAALLGSLIPIVVILFMQIRIRSFWDANNAIIGLLYSLINAAVFQVFLKWLIGGLRPHFLSVCQPQISATGAQTGTGFRQIMYDRSICTGDRDQIDDSLESFPSGHSTAAFAGFVFLSLYLNAKLKVWSNYHPAFWKLIATYAPILGATLIAGALTIDEFHNWYDCLAGAIIGTIMAFSAYRMVYASVWDFRFNHIPLTRHTPFSYGAGAPGAGGFETAIWTRQAGWGHEEGAFGGAPFDAGYGMRGAGEAMGGLHGGNGITGPNGYNGGMGGHNGSPSGYNGSPNGYFAGSTGRNSGVIGHQRQTSAGMVPGVGMAQRDHSIPRKSLERKPVGGNTPPVRGEQMV